MWGPTRSSEAGGDRAQGRGALVASVSFDTRSAVPSCLGRGPCFAGSVGQVWLGLAPGSTSAADRGTEVPASSLLRSILEPLRGCAAPSVNSVRRGSLGNRQTSSAGALWSSIAGSSSLARAFAQARLAARGGAVVRRLGSRRRVAGTGTGPCQTACSEGPTRTGEPARAGWQPCRCWNGVDPFAPCAALTSSTDEPCPACQVAFGVGAAAEAVTTLGIGPGLSVCRQRPSVCARGCCASGRRPGGTLNPGRVFSRQRTLREERSSR